MSLSLTSVTADNRQYRTGYAAACSRTVQPKSRSSRLRTNLVPDPATTSTGNSQAPDAPGSYSSRRIPRYCCATRRSKSHEKVIATVALAISLVPSATMAQERGGDAALGALSGAIVFGPVGAVAGALVGYTAGPSIARSWGLRRSGTARHARRSVRQETRVSRVDGQAAAVNPAPVNQVAAPAPAQAPPPRAASNAPPVQALE